jgi:hypothetical protein
VPKSPPAQSALRLLADGKTERELLTSAIHDVESDGPLRILEAGCGQRWPLVLEGRQLHITGVDTDAAAMRIRRERHGDLDVEMVADLRDATCSFRKLASMSSTAASCWNTSPAREMYSIDSGRQCVPAAGS